MIVRDEAPTIKRCIESVKGAVDCFAIIDTGSRDGTLSAARSALADLPGKFEQQKWTGDFALHRNQALELCRTVTSTLNHADAWALFIDADESLLLSRTNLREFLASAQTVVCWYAAVNEYNFLKIAAARVNVQMHWMGQIHETLGALAIQDISVLPGASITYGSDGNRRHRDPTLEHDVQILWKQAAEARDEFWKYFYLARTYESRAESVAALDAFRLAYDASTSSEQRFQALWGQLRVAREHAALAPSYAELAERLLKESNAARAEPLCALSEIALRQGQVSEARALALAALRCPTPTLTLGYDAGSYSWKPRVLLAHYWDHVGSPARAREHLIRATQSGQIPTSIRTDLEVWLHSSLQERR